ncbi:retinol dehydrogenase 12-like isoform X2 [Narcine bancroftii]|uniref:retinol dehydrogenase 12-like isoform X2 n=1 Tax=Narcine bancroftii TaxID=1343680 RepID=UPI0038319C18
MTWILAFDPGFSVVLPTRCLAKAFRTLSRHLYIIAGLGLAGTSLLVLRKWTSGGSCRCTTRMDGKTVVITGGGSGIGKETARELAQRGARVILACRDEVRGKQVARELREGTGNQEVVVTHLDLASLTSIRCFAEEMSHREGRLDVLVNNAGAPIGPRQVTEDGLELQMGVNHFGHFLLTLLLLDGLKCSAPSRVINVASRAHAIGTGVTVNAVHPGVVWTDAMRSLICQQPLWVRLLVAPFYFCLKSPRQGAQTTIHCAVAPGLEKVTGQYFSDCRVVEVSHSGQDDCTAKSLWDLSLEMVQLEVPPNSLKDSVHRSMSSLARGSPVRRNRTCVY